MLIDHFRLDEEATLQEWANLKNLPNMDNVEWREVMTTIVNHHHDLMPNLAKLARVALVLPISTAGMGPHILLVTCAHLSIVHDVDFSFVTWIM